MPGPVPLQSTHTESVAGSDGTARIYPLIVDEGNRALLVDWLEGHEQYEPVTDEPFAEAVFDLCILDHEGLEQNFEQLQQRKADAVPVLLPYLYLMPQLEEEFLTNERSRLGDTLLEAKVDELLTIPVRKAELEWRIKTLLRLRAHTQTLVGKDQRLDRLNKAIESTGQAVYMTDTEGIITFVNPAFERITGYSATEAIGNSPNLLNSGAMDDRYFTDFWATIESGNIWDEEIINQRKSGDHYYAQQTVSPFFTTDGEIAGYVAIQADITNRKQLETTQYKYRHAIESSGDLLVAIDTDESLLFANDAYREYHSLPDGPLEGRSLKSVVGERAYEDAEENISAALSGETIQYDTTRTHPTLGPRLLQVIYHPLRDEHGEIVGATASLQDITSYQEETRQLETLISNLPGIVYRVANTVGWPMTFVGGQCEQITGYPASAIEAGDVSWFDDIIHPADRSETLATIEAAVDADEPFETTYRITTATGEVRWVLEYGQKVDPLTSDESVVEGVIMDVTTQREQEAELYQMSDAIDKAPIGITMTDPSKPDNPLTYVNKGFEDLTGYTAAEAIGRNCRFLQGDNTSDSVVQQIRNAIDANEPVSVVLRNYRADGTEFWNQLRVAPVKDNHGEVTNFIGFQQDVTERMERQRQVKKIDQVLRHNLSNDMNLIQGLAEFISEGTTDEDLQAHAAKILSTSDRLLATAHKERQITSLLSDDPVIWTVDLVEVIRQVVAEVGEAFPEADISVTAASDVSVRATTHLATAVKEIVWNAVLHNPRSSPRVEITVEEAASTVSLCVTDNGPGIPEMEHDILMGADESPLYHADGLGLWLVHLIIRRSNGTIDIDHPDGGGSAVIIRLQKSNGKDSA